MSVRKLYTDIIPGDAIVFGNGQEEVKIELLARTGKKARLKVEAPDSVTIDLRKQSSGGLLKIEGNNHGRNDCRG